MSTDLSDRLRESLARRAARTPQPTFQANTLIYRGRRAQRNRQLGAVAAAALAVAIVVGSVVALTWNVGPQPLPPVQPPAPTTTMRLPAIGPCTAGDWGFVGAVGVRANQRLTLVPKPAAVPLKDITYDFDGDGKAERLQKFVCTVGKERVEGVEALTETGPNSAVALGGLTAALHDFIGSYPPIGIYQTERSSIDSGTTYQTIVTVNGNNTLVWVKQERKWSWFGG